MSDGDANVASLIVRQWTEREWLEAEAVWTDLLGRSNADPLFLSWGWLTHWWQSFGRQRQWDLRILATYRGEQLVGLAPMYRVRANRSFLKVSSLQFIGVAWRDPTALISEYLDFIAAVGSEAEVRAAFLEHILAERDWSELVISFARSPETWLHSFANSSLGNGAGRRYYGRAIEHSVAYQAELKDGFPAYLRGLGQSTRRSLWHLRSRLASLGKVQVEQVSEAGIAEGFEQLNRLHELRWGQPAFSADRLRFHLAFAQARAARGELAMSRLLLDGRVVSMLYDIRRSGRQYNLKAGFDPSVARNFSLGYLHFGYAMEAAAERNVQLYDFMAGCGRKTDYKSHLGQQQEKLATVQLLRGMLLPRLYRWHDGRSRQRMLTAS